MNGSFTILWVKENIFRSAFFQKQTLSQGLECNWSIRRSSQEKPERSGGNGTGKRKKVGKGAFQLKSQLTHIPRGTEHKLHLRVCSSYSSMSQCPCALMMPPLTRGQCEQCHRCDQFAWGGMGTQDPACPGPGGCWVGHRQCPSGFHLLTS